jgi:hypothetical protein
MSKLILQGDNTTYPGFSLLGESSLAITMDEIGVGDLNALDFLTLSGTTSVSIASTGAAGGQDLINQLIETTNNLTTVTISGTDEFFLQGKFSETNSSDGVVTDIAAKAASPTTIHSSLTLINASATTGGVQIEAGATNTSSDGQFLNGASLNANVTITYGGLTIKGGSGTDGIENDAKNGIVTDGNGSGDIVILGGAGAKATLGTGSGDQVSVGRSFIGTNETPGSALGDKVTFGAAATADLIVSIGAEAGSTAGTGSIGLTKVLKAADGMTIDFTSVTTSHFIFDETQQVMSVISLTKAENAAVNAMGGAGVVYFAYKGNEYFIATNTAEAAVSSGDAIVELVGVTNIHHASNNFGLVTLHV